MNNSCEGAEPYARKFNGKDIVLRKDLPTSTRKESNKEIIMWKKGKDYIYSVKSKKSRSKNYDEVGKHLILHEDLETENTKYNSPFLMDCKGEEKLKNNEIENVMKPYMTTENIEIQNETAIEANIGEDNELKETLRNFVDEWLYTVDKEIIVNIGAVIQKGDELCLDGFLGMELIPKSSDIYKFNFDGILSVKKHTYVSKDDKMVTQKAIQDVKVPAIKKELISCEQTIKEIEFKMNNLLVDEYSLRFCHSNGGNITIDWSASFRLINNENNNIEEVTNKEDAITRCF
ncbi:hypothetical protein GLOIN_2v1772543 [Rhizophagus irregularis DAOM 181602=DAOM 197198]|uniref:Uncharacterized protein n=1 Tax=Rhizophagus irregularis (strain DAOM 181602 / DAOM 197198 / MUCL 43194) TaxID=747089 RepID=A0A2P4Q750_RHIID|nr:hypothetical protein GLOIN_2v1772543 [Rhizophagus irregularis DAOM 181602=DAOM 197198]POG73466.1 hypothetical protein GLOIN_2v1772543 [Rhizophagus irregularis DAOM 181602=DAOM 197198]|eukprot:XP_025180332.1 hypothetical protein GLOIN_2v1772543 [Rhizophagus irregularis DAOM 181602=DAOM 197198]